ncbi:hypothetical protein CDAR_319001 [Caerostris darwini]|uniref:Uncharacterized protein n=1 Tax=Caerostris darwini TaxID=1538125 RepID=A0AAV4TYV9_9ARAC|nr:hypothetical protein CDAR_319001 [Caerostris darwini]
MATHAKCQNEEKRLRNHLSFSASFHVRSSLNDSLLRSSALRLETPRVSSGGPPKDRCQNNPFHRQEVHKSEAAYFHKLHLFFTTAAGTPRNAVR